MGNFHHRHQGDDGLLLPRVKDLLRLVKDLLRLR
jgi:hypothetical protein